MKRGDLLRHLRKYGCHLKREGGAHSLWTNPTTGAVEAVPRHTEISALRQPGTNATGLSNQADEFHVKLLHLLKEAFPAAARVAVLHDPLNPPLARILPDLTRTGATLGLKVRVIEARSPAELGAAFKVLKSEQPDVLYVLGAASFNSQGGRIAELANGQHQVTVYGLNEFADAGRPVADGFAAAEWCVRPQKKTLTTDIMFEETQK